MQTTPSKETKALWCVVAFAALYGAAQITTEATAIFVAVPLAALIVLIVLLHYKPNNDV
jgi:hypothetical protein